jgi:hypothetical protein
MDGGGLAGSPDSEVDTDDARYALRRRSAHIVNDSQPKRDWLAWHAPYDDPSSRLAKRLAVVRRRVAEALDRAPAGPIRVVSVCAGQGRDLLGVLATHPRRRDVRARLVELDPRNAGPAREAAAEHPGVEVLEADASLTDAYAGAVPADLVLVCGVFGNITDEDIQRVIRHLSMLCAAGATVIWTRHRYAPDRVPDICTWFETSGFAEVSVDSPESEFFAVGVHRLRGQPARLEPGIRLFRFVEREELRR